MVKCTYTALHPLLNKKQVNNNFYMCTYMYVL